MFENLDQSKGQNLTGQTPATATAAIRPPEPAVKSPLLSKGGPGSGYASMPQAPVVEDMFAGVKDIGPAAKITSALNKPSKPADGSAKSGGGFWRVLLIIVIILVILGLGIFLVGRFMGVEITSPASWENKFPALSVLFGNQPGQTVVVNNQTPAPDNNTPQPTTPVNTPTQPANPTTPVIPAITTPAVTTSTLPVVPPTPAVSTSSNPVSIITDSDSDGLSDQEEAALGTNPLKADTDGDSYSDFTEVGNLFNPLGAGALSADPNISEYQNTKQGYSVLYPKIFTVQDVVNNDGSVIVFSASANFSIQVSVQPNSAKLDILSWYNQQFPNTPAKAGDIVTRNGLSGIFSPDKDNFFLTDEAKAKLFTITYNPASKGDKTYYNIFLIIIHSLKEIVQ